MPRDDRVTQHMAEKIKRGEVLPELRNMPEVYSTMRTVPVKCLFLYHPWAYPTYGDTFDNSLK